MSHIETQGPQLDMTETVFRAQLSEKITAWNEEYLSEDIVGLREEEKAARVMAGEVIGQMSHFVSQALASEDGRATAYEIDMVAEGKRPPVADGRRPHIEMRPWGMIERFCDSTGIPYVEREVFAKEKGRFDPVAGHETGISRSIVIDMSSVKDRWSGEMMRSFGALTDAGSVLNSGDAVIL